MMTSGTGRNTRKGVAGATAENNEYMGGLFYG